MRWHSTRHHLVDDERHVTHVVSIDVPHRLPSLDRPDLIVVLDGAWMAGTVRDATRIMSMGGEAPEAVVVGAAFHADSMKQYLRERARWFTPTAWVPPAETGVVDVSASDMGHAASYRVWLRDTLLPFVAAELDRGADDFGATWLVGHSFSGLFGLTDLFAGASFDRYLLASPSIWWHDRAILERERGWNPAPGEAPVDLYVSTGSHEVFTSDGADPYRMGANADELVERLRTREGPQLRVHREVIAGHGHNSTIGPAVAAGLRHLHQQRAGA